MDAVPEFDEALFGMLAMNLMQIEFVIRSEVKVVVII
jgi:hypothetical protein